MIRQMLESGAVVDISFDTNLNVHCLLRTTQSHVHSVVTCMV